jgi:hypothetical protein
MITVTPSVYPKDLPLLRSYKYTTTLTYVHPGSEDVSKNEPITLSAWVIFQQHIHACLHHSPEELELIQEHGECTLGHWGTMDEDGEPPMSSVVSPDFISLRPGETWSHTFNFSPGGDLVEPLVVGETYTWRIIGATIDWWDYGTLQVISSSHLLWSFCALLLCANFNRTTSTPSSNMGKQAMTSVPKLL